MSQSTQGTIVYYVVSPVHVRNAQLLAPVLQGWKLRLAYEQESPWLNPGNMYPLPFENVALPPDGIPAGLWAGAVCGVVMSTAQPRPLPMLLVAAALERGVPTIGIEESNQIALNQGKVNNYVLPVDHVLVASAHEAQGMAAGGFPVSRFEATGWPFYSGRIGAVAPQQRRARKEALGLDPDRPVASLTLTGLYDAGESPVVRHRQLSLAAQGLPPEYQFVVKPHPIEKRAVLQPFIDESAPRAVVVEGMVRAEELLEASDVLLNRGVSQVCIEALFLEIPVLVLDTGVQTPFHGLAAGLVVERPADLGRALEQLRREPEPMRLYDAFRQRHVPFAPLAARERTCERIAAICQGAERDPALGRQWFDLALCQAWKAERKLALQLVSKAEVAAAGCPGEALGRLIDGRASREDLEALSRYLGEGFQGQVLRALWIDQLERRGTRPEPADLAWLRGFPSPLDAVWFIPDARRWALLLLRSGQRAEAAELEEHLRGEFIHVPGVPELLADLSVFAGGGWGRARIALKDEARRRLVLLRHRLRRLLA
jgi:hypothetical protein